MECFFKAGTCSSTPNFNQDSAVDEYIVSNSLPGLPPPRGDGSPMAGDSSIGGFCFTGESGGVG